MSGSYNMSHGGVTCIRFCVQMTMAVVRVTSARAFPITSAREEIMGSNPDVAQDRASRPVLPLLHPSNAYSKVFAGICELIVNRMEGSSWDLLPEDYPEGWVIEAIRGHMWCKLRVTHELPGHADLIKFEWRDGSIGGNKSFDLTPHNDVHALSQDINDVLDMLGLV